jgi:hypothetical protein
LGDPQAPSNLSLDPAIQRTAGGKCQAQIGGERKIASERLRPYLL